jgi:DNA-binding NarL/FixJ family response regulator
MISLLIIDNNRQEAERLAMRIKGQPGVESVDYATCLGTALDKLDYYNVALVSGELANDEAYKLVKIISRAGNDGHVLILGSHETSSMIVRFIEAGAHGYICRDIPTEVLIQQIRSAQRNEVNLSPETTALVMHRLAELAAWFEDLCPTPGAASKLTRREREVLHLISRNYTNQDIANHLIIEVGTVKNHVHNILSKLKVSTRSEAATYLFTAGSHRQRISVRETRIPVQDLTRRYERIGIGD